MKKIMHFIAASCAALLLTATPASAVNAIPAEQIDEQQIYFGSAKSFEKAATVDYTAVVKATPEYAEIKKKKIDSSTARYWILMSNASEHAVQMISQVGEETDHDLIVAIGYLGKITPPLAAEDVTDRVLEKLEPNKKQAKNETGDAKPARDKPKEEPREQAKEKKNTSKANARSTSRGR